MNMKRADVRLWTCEVKFYDPNGAGVENIM